MKAVVCTEFGPIERLAIHDVPEPALRAGCVRIAMKSVTVNPPDLLMPQGKYQVKPMPPFVAGVEGAGVVLESGEGVAGFAPGDRVMTYAGEGCFAEQVVVPAFRVFRTPDGMDDDAAAGFILVYGTAHHAVVDCGELARGQTLTVLGAAGGIGIAAIQIGKALGASVIAIASTPEKLAKCREHGADHLVLNSEPIRDRIRELTGGRGADVILDVVGGDVTNVALRAIAPYGRYVIAGYASGVIPMIQGNLVVLKQAKVVGASFRLLLEQTPDLGIRSVQKLCELYETGLLRPEVSARYPFDRFLEAMRLVADRKVIGKVAIRL
ncbi:MAG: NADPH:quinone oxidoreductase family protein [Burkholderiales bacterium]